MRADATQQNINTLRCFATFFLVSYHVIGTDADSGIHVGYPSAFRFFSDALIDVRMPLFAFIAGAVYGLRPLVLADAAGFFIGKFHRLVVPGITASVIFWLYCNLILKGGFAYDADLMSLVLLTTGHFWFLQAILLIFLVVGLLDAALRYRATLVLFLAALALTFVWAKLSFPYIPHLEMTGTIYLTPYFLLGLLLVRHHAAIMAWRRVIIIAATGLFCLGIYLNIGIYQATGQLSDDRFDLQSLAVGGGTILLAHLLFPRIAVLDRFAIYCFTIYLYHPFGTSAVRHLFSRLDVHIPTLHFVIGVTAGLVLPCLMHMMANRFDPSRRLILGLRPKNGMPLMTNQIIG